MVRSGVLAVVLAWFTACEPTTGLQFEIDATGDPTATEVMVYVGKGEGEAASIAAEQRFPSEMHEGQFWPRELDDPETFKLTATDRTATLSFAPGGDSSKVTVVAVGLTNGAPTSLATQTIRKVRTDLVEVWTLKLEPTKDDVDTTTGRAVLRWGTDPGELTCVQAVDRAARVSEHRNIFIGRSGDHDCDGHRKLLEDNSPNPAECDDDWHDARVKPSVDTLSCMEEHVVQGAPEQCILGGPQCVDGETATNTQCSHARPFCAPAGLCARCERTATPEERFTCALTDDPRLTPDATLLPFMRCDVAVSTSNGGRQLCPTRFKLTPTFSGMTATCIGAPRFHSSDPGTGWASTVEIGGLSVAFSRDAAVPGCNINIIPTHVATQSIVSSGSFEHGLFAIDVNASRGVIAPIVFAFEDTAICPVSERPCTPINWDTSNDTVFACLQP